MLCLLRGYKICIYTITYLFHAVSPMADAKFREKMSLLNNRILLFLVHGFSWIVVILITEPKFAILGQLGRSIAAGEVETVAEDTGSMRQELSYKSLTRSHYL